MASTIDRARSYLARMEEAISGQGGHSTTFKAACVLVHGFALSVEEALPLMLEYNERCVPPWTEKELRHKLTDAAKVTNHQHPRGHLLGSPSVSRRDNSEFIPAAPRSKAIPYRRVPPPQPQTTGIVDQKVKNSEVSKPAETVPVNSPETTAEKEVRRIAKRQAAGKKKPWLIIFPPEDTGEPPIECYK